MQSFGKARASTETTHRNFELRAKQPGVQKSSCVVRQNALQYSWPQGPEGHHNGGRIPSFAPFLPEKAQRGVRYMVTHEELYIFCTLIVAVIALVLGIKDKK